MLKCISTTTTDVLEVKIADKYFLVFKKTRLVMKLAVILLLLLKDKNGKRVFTYRQVSETFGAKSRQWSNNFLREFKACDENLFDYLVHKRKVDAEVKTFIEETLEDRPDLTQEELKEKVNQKFPGLDVIAHTMGKVIRDMDCRGVLRRFRGFLKERGNHLMKDWLVKRLLRPGGKALKKKLIKMWRWDRDTAVTHTLVPREQQPSESAGSSQPLSGVALCIAWLFVAGLSYRKVGHFLNCSKSLVGKIIDRVAGFRVGPWLAHRAIRHFSGRVAIDEKWVKIDGVWRFLFAAVDTNSGLVLHQELMPANSLDCYRLFLLQLKELGYCPVVIITDGLIASFRAIKEVFPRTRHYLCHIHLQRAMFEWVRRNIMNKKKGDLLIKAISDLFKSESKPKLRGNLQSLLRLDDNLTAYLIANFIPKLDEHIIRSLNSSIYPSSTNAVESYFSRLDAWYQRWNHFKSERSAHRLLNSFLLMHYFSRTGDSRTSPLERHHVQLSCDPVTAYIHKMINITIPSYFQMAIQELSKAESSFEQQKDLAAHHRSIAQFYQRFKEENDDTTPLRRRRKAKQVKTGMGKHRPVRTISSNRRKAA